jgi:putative ATP-dependent endonuclease of OLD family
MKVAAVKLEGFRNFKSALVKFNGNSLIIGANDVGKTNLLYAIRLLMDRTIAESELEPQESDFHIDVKGKQSTEFA